MKIVAYVEATVSLAYAWDEIRPVSGIAPNAVINSLAERYQFQNLGFSQASQQIGLFTPSLQVGEFVDNGRSINIASVDFQSTFFVVNGTESKDVMSFVEDMFSFLGQEHGFRRPKDHRRRIDKSTIISDLGFPIEECFEKWSAVASLYSELSSDTLDVKTAGIKFLMEGIGTGISSTGVIERRMGAPAGENWTFSNLMLDTDNHEKLLGKVAEIFSQKH